MRKVSPKKPIVDTELPFEAGFVHIPRNGGMSIRFLLRDMPEICLLLDRSLNSKRNHENGITVLKNELDKNQYKKLYKFGFSRGPFSRAVSLYHYACKINKEIKELKNFEDFVVNYLRFFDVNNNSLYYKVGDPDWHNSLDNVIHHASAQTHPKFMIKDLQFLGKLEYIDLHFHQMLISSGLQQKYIYRSPPKLNSTTHSHFTHYYNTRTKEIIREVYQKDFEFLDYNFS